MAEKNRKLKVGIIGTGAISEMHIESYLKQPDTEIVAAADLVPGKAEKMMAKFGLTNARCYPDHLAMLQAEKDLDAVSVCTYNSTHAVCAIDTLNAGVNVLLEKPMCVTTQEAVEIIRAEKASGKVLSVGFQPRFDANMNKIKEIVDSGALGKVYYIQTGGGRRRGLPENITFVEKQTAGLGALGDIGCYSLDMVLRAVGYPKPITVSGYTSNYFGTNPTYNTGTDPARFAVDDFAAAFVRLENDIVLDFRISWAMHANTPGDTLLLGTEGALRIPSTNCWNGTVGGKMTLYYDKDGQRKEKKIKILDKNCNWDDLWLRKIRSFLDAVWAGAPSPIPSSEILINQTIIDAIATSAQLGREIAIEIPEV